MINLNDVIHLGSEVPFPTPGRFLYIAFENVHVCEAPQNSVEKNAEAFKMHSLTGELQSALHGTSLGAAAQIIRDRCFTPAKNITERRQGVYCEGGARKAQSRMYSTLNFPRYTHIDNLDEIDTCMYSIFFDIAVNRDKGYTVHHQWVQPPETIIIAGIYVHALPFGKLFADGFRGHFMYASSVHQSIHEHPYVVHHL